MAMRIICGEYDDEEEVEDHLQEEHDEHEKGDDEGDCVRAWKVRGTRLRLSKWSGCCSRNSSAN